MSFGPWCRVVAAGRPVALPAGIESALYLSGCHGMQGTLLIVISASIAAFNAFQLSRRYGRTLAQKLIQSEMGEDGEDESNIVKSKLAEVQEAIESGGFFKQLVAIFVLRLTPVVPFRCVGGAIAQCRDCPLACAAIARGAGCAGMCAAAWH